MTRIAFLADVHVDAFGHKLDPATGLNARLADMLASLRWAAADALAQGAEALVVAGDFTERRHAPAWLVALIRDALAVGPARQVYLRGNHDGEMGGRSIVDVLSDGYERIGASQPALVTVGDRDASVTLAMLPFVDRHWLRAQPDMESVPDADVRRVLGERVLAMARGLYASARSIDGRPLVLVLHQTIGGGWLSDTQQAFMGDLDTVVDGAQLAAIGFDLVIAGHLHRHQVVVSGVRPVLYVGSLDRVDFAEADHPKGYVLADIESGAAAEWRFVENPIARHWVTLRGDSWSPHMDDIPGALVRLLDLDPDADAVSARAQLEALGAWDVTEIRTRMVERLEVAGGMSEDLSPHQALDEFFIDDEDREQLVARGREIIEAAR